MHNEEMKVGTLVNDLNIGDKTATVNIEGSFYVCFDGTSGGFHGTRGTKVRVQCFNLNIKGFPKRRVVVDIERKPVEVFPSITCGVSDTQPKTKIDISLCDDGTHAVHLGRRFNPMDIQDLRFRIAGVASVYEVDAYCVTLRIAKLFDAEEVLKKIEQLLTSS